MTSLGPWNGFEIYIEERLHDEFLKINKYLEGGQGRNLNFEKDFPFEKYQDFVNEGCLYVKEDSDSEDSDSQDSEDSEDSYSEDFEKNEIIDFFKKLFYFLFNRCCCIIFFYKAIPFFFSFIVECVFWFWVGRSEKEKN